VLTLSAGLSGWCECVRVRQSRALEDGEKEVKGELIVFVQKIDFHRLASPTTPQQLLKNFTLSQHYSPTLTSTQSNTQESFLCFFFFFRDIAIFKAP